MGSGHIVQISVSRGGVPKLPIPEGNAKLLGLEGDGHAHPEIHGGADRAVLLITAEGIEELAAGGFHLTYGSLGENLTTRGIDRREWRSGQRWKIGQEVVIQITRRRSPCRTLNVYPGIQAAMFDALVQAEDPSSPKWGLSGFYASIVHPGLIRRGDEIVPA